MPSLKEDTTNHDDDEEEDETGFSTFGRMSVPASKYALRSEYSTGFMSCLHSHSWLCAHVHDYLTVAMKCSYVYSYCIVIVHASYS